jgi:hypothetical protein
MNLRPSNLRNVVTLVFQFSFDVIEVCDGTRSGQFERSLNGADTAFHGFLLPHARPAFSGNEFNARRFENSPGLRGFEGV